MSNTTISERILTMTKYLNVSVNDFAKQLGYNRSQVLYDIMHLKSKPSFSFFEKLNDSAYADTFSMEWLINGNGEMLKKNGNTNISNLQKELVTLLSLNDAQKDLINLQKKEIDRLQKQEVEI
jgi:hypothetical protein